MSEQRLGVFWSQLLLIHTESRLHNDYYFRIHYYLTIKITTYRNWRENLERCSSHVHLCHGLGCGSKDRSDSFVPDFQAF